MFSGGPSISVGKVYNVPLKFELLHLFIPVLLITQWYLPTIDAATAVYGSAISAIYIIAGALLLLEISILAHEYAHVRMGQKLGYETKEVRMIMFGAVAMMAGTGKTPISQFLIAVAGPVVSFAIWAVCVYVIPTFFPDIGPNTSLIIYLTGQINLILGIFNMLPVFPMDGGRILVSILWPVLGCFVKAMKVGAVVAIAFCLYGLYYGLVNEAYILLFFAVIVTFVSAKTLRSSHAEILVMRGGKEL